MASILASFARSILCALIAVYLFAQASTAVIGRSKCAKGTQSCGLACATSDMECKDNRCWNSSGQQVLCYPTSSACGESNCPLFAWCDRGQQCVPNTCEHRHRVWCPEDHGVLRQVKCINQAVKTQCFSSGSGVFSCHTGGGMVVAMCGSRMAIGLVAVPRKSSSQNRLQYQQYKKDSSLSQGLNKLLSPKQDQTTGIAATPVPRRSLLQLSSVISSIAKGVSSGVKASLGYAIGAQYGMYNPYGLSGLMAGTAGSSNPYTTNGLLASNTDSSFNIFTNNYGDLSFLDGDYSSINTQNGGHQAGQGYPDNQYQQTSYLNTDYTSGASGYAPPSGSAMPSTNQLNSSPYSTAGGQAMASITPAVGSNQNTIQSGNSPGGIFVSAGQGGGLVAGSYGGGYTGAYNAATGTYGLGANYGYAEPYHGKASGNAMVFMPAWYAPNYPNMTYPCPTGMPVGTMISVGIPCGVALVSLPASELPTINGLPAAVDLSKAGLADAATPPSGSTPSRATSSLSTYMNDNEAYNQPYTTYTPYSGMRLGSVDNSDTNAVGNIKVGNTFESGIVAAKSNTLELQGSKDAVSADAESSSDTYMASLLAAMAETPSKKPPKQLNRKQGVSQ